MARRRRTRPPRKRRGGKREIDFRLISNLILANSLSGRKTLKRPISSIPTFAKESAYLKVDRKVFD
jgi:hypothetical protein